VAAEQVVDRTGPAVGEKVRQVEVHVIALVNREGLMAAIGGSDRTARLAWAGDHLD
jgi:hypothetical protein